MWVRAEGCKDLITHVFDAQTEHLRDDAVFGVRTAWSGGSSPTTAASWRRPFDIVLDRA
jgi:hypothetical protein